MPREKYFQLESFGVCKSLVINLIIICLCQINQSYGHKDHLVQTAQYGQVNLWTEHGILKNSTSEHRKNFETRLDNVFSAKITQIFGKFSVNFQRDISAPADC